jgi:hypothetical protein
VLHGGALVNALWSTRPSFQKSCQCFADLFSLFEASAEGGDGSSKKVIINFGEGDIIKKQVDKQLLADAKWAILSVVLATIMLRIGSQSTFITVVGIFMIVVRVFHGGLVFLGLLLVEVASLGQTSKIDSPSWIYHFSRMGLCGTLHIRHAVHRPFMPQLL